MSQLQSSIVHHILLSDVYSQNVSIYPDQLVCASQMVLLQVMLRDRYHEFHLRKRKQPSSIKSNETTGMRVPWQNDYYHFKSQLQAMAAKNQQLTQMVAQYSFNPSVFNLKQLEIILNTHCRKIDELDNWITHFPFSQESAAESQLEVNLTRHMKECLFAQIKTIFQFKQQVTDITAQANSRERSFNAFQQSASVSYGALNNSEGSVTGNERNGTIREVTARIENLNLVLRRMGEMVAQQGGLVDRIDEHLVAGHSNVRKGRDKLKERVDQQQGEVDEFSCEGRVNKVILAFYLTDLILILVLVLKNL